MFWIDPFWAKDLVFHSFIPQPQFDKVAHQVLVHDDELSRQDAAGVEVGCVGLKALVVAQDLRSGCRWHQGNQQRIAQPYLGNLRLLGPPSPSAVLAVPPTYHIGRGLWRREIRHSCQ